MARQTISLILDGRPTLNDYVTALENWQELISISAASTGITWEIDGLEISSAMTTAVGISEDEVELLRVTDELVSLGKELRLNGVPKNSKYRKAARGLLSVLNGRVPSIRFENDRDDVTIDSPAIRELVTVEPSVFEFKPTLGAVEGRIQTVSNRVSLRFVLYDMTFDKAVSCYLKVGQEDWLQNAWGKIAIVEGAVKRDPHSGRPTTIRDVVSIHLRDEGVPGRWRDAQGILRDNRGDESAVATIRRYRDAE
jgi:hypothetical protein